jgi:hypothetical protein
MVAAHQSEGGVGIEKQRVAPDGGILEAMQELDARRRFKVPASSKDDSRFKKQRRKEHGMSAKKKKKRQCT